ncbi:hypothetical protein EV586_11439 [Tumebacillus sp. BK434]|uniref:transporter suffix domain-containing protein n=1 Tax=Tumebacillus sp. BK434 TaxID=2512169 RepID=UPI00104B1230|nr:transporter suffix domain-containing protein [Tumebacillus sp. BK434]TCP52188.1 hypothetical protein EV586_11439 [Tumebacillus sp. BK434]
MTKKYFGIVLIGISFLLYGAIFLVPFTPFPTGVKATLVAGLAIAGEVTFWIGGFFVGRELVKKYRSKLNPFKRKTKEPDIEKADTP